MQLRPQMKIHPLIKETCASKKITVEKMLTEIASETNRKRFRITWQYRGYYPLEQEVAEAFSKHTGLSVEALLKASDERIDDVELDETALNKIIPEWIVEHLDLYGNTVIPNNLIKLCGGVDGFIEKMKLESGKDIRIIENKITEQGIPLETTYKKRKYKIGYVAEEIQDWEKVKKHGTKRTRKRKK